jgi:hypothetical protein
MTSKDIRSALWFVGFPLVPFVLLFFTALGCDLAGVGITWAWLVVPLGIIGAAWACWYGQKRGADILWDRRK